MPPEPVERERAATEITSTERSQIQTSLWSAITASGKRSNGAPIVSAPTAWPKMSVRVITMMKPIIASDESRVKSPSTMKSGKMNSAKVPAATTRCAKLPSAAAS